MTLVRRRAAPHFRVLLRQLLQYHRLRLIAIEAELAVEDLLDERTSMFAGHSICGLLERLLQEIHLLIRGLEPSIAALEDRLVALYLR